MADLNYSLDELSSEDILKAASGVMLGEKREYNGGTSYMDDIGEITLPDDFDYNYDPAETSSDERQYGDSGAEFVPIDELDSIEVPEISGFDLAEILAGDPSNPNYSSSETAPHNDELDLDSVEVPEFSDEDELPFKKEPPKPKPAPPPVDPFADPFEAQFPSRRKKKQEEPPPRDLITVETPEIANEEGLLETNMDSGPVQNPNADQSFGVTDLEIAVPEFSDSEVLPDIGPVIIKDKKIKKKRTFEDDFPMPLRAGGIGGRTGTGSSYGSGAGSAPKRPMSPDDFPPPPRPAAAPKKPLTPDDFPPPPKPTAPPPPKPAPAPAPEPPKPEKESFFGKLFGKHKK